MNVALFHMFMTFMTFMTFILDHGRAQIPKYFREMFTKFTSPLLSEG